MNTIPVAYHKWHVVSGPVGGTVTSVDGSVTYCTIPEGGQGSFYAVTTEVVVSDASISVDDCQNFKCALVKFRLLGQLGGGVDALPQGYFAAEFLEATGSQRLKLGITQPGAAEYDLQFTAFDNDSQCMGYNYSYSKWGVLTNKQYRLGAKTNTLPEYANGRQKVTFAVMPSETKETLQINNGAVYTYEDARINSFGEWCLWQATDDSATNCKARIWRFSLKSLNEDLLLSLLPALNAKGQACFYDIVQKKEFVNTALYVGLTCKQALQLSKLPAGGGTLKISLPWDAQLDKKVDEALDIAKSKGWTIEIQYQEPDTTSAVYNKYAACTSVADMQAVNADYKTDLTAEGNWVYPLPNVTNGDKLFQNAQIAEFVLDEIPNPGNAYFAFSGNKKIKRFYTRLPKMAWFDRTFHNTSLEVFDYNGETFSPGVISLAFNDSKSFRTFNAVFGKKISNAELAFSNCQLDKESVLRIAGSALPSSAGVKITMGMHVDHENDEEVLAALDTMEANGWALTAQWNGTATAQTASSWGLRRKLVYAKVVEIDGEQYLDWGHYVTDWEANGYQEFASVEEAKEHFNIGD